MTSSKARATGLLWACWLSDQADWFCWQRWRMQLLHSALAGFATKLNSIAKPMRHSLTYDQGKEMSRDAELREQTGVNSTHSRPA